MITGLSALFHLSFLSGFHLWWRPEYKGTENRWKSLQSTARRGGIFGNWSYISVRIMRKRKIYLSFSFLPSICYNDRVEL